MATSLPRVQQHSFFVERFYLEMHAVPTLVVAHIHKIVKGWRGHGVLFAVMLPPAHWRVRPPCHSLLSLGYWKEFMYFLILTNIDLVMFY